MPSAYILSQQISLYGERDCIGFGNNEFYVKEIQRELERLSRSEDVSLKRNLYSYIVEIIR